MPGRQVALYQPPKRYTGRKRRFRHYTRGLTQLGHDMLYVKSLINSELHYDYSSYNTTISSTGSIHHLTAVAQDDTNTGRSGNSILPRYLNLLFKFQNDNALDWIRFMVFRWKDNSTPTIADIVEDSSNPVFSPLNDNIAGNRKDRKIDVIKNKTFVFGDASYSNAIQYKKMIDLNPPVKQMKDHVKYDNTTTTSPMGGIYIMVVGIQAVNLSSLSGMAKLSFHDN